MARRLALSVAGVLAVVGCNVPPPIADRTQFCANTESKRIKAGTRVIVASVPSIKSSNGVAIPFRNIGVTLEVRGNAPDVSPDFFLGVCPRDCMNDLDRSNFLNAVRATTDDDGVLIYTIDSGPGAAGFVLEDWGDATCTLPLGADAFE